MRVTSAPIGVLLASLMLVGCSDEGFAPEEHFGVAESWIINGQLDTTHQAVVALFGQQSGCTGTIIHVAGNSAYVLTAAHCFGYGPIQQVAVGNDFYQATAVMNVVEYQIHPQYNTQQLIYDFAILRATPANANTPVIPALTPGEDSLVPGTQVTHVGYGLTSYPNGSTSKRHYAVGNLAEVAQIQIAYNQPVAGPCSGDSGGPNLVQTAGGERVAGVVSYGDQQCSQFGVSGRTSAIYDNFIAPFIGTEPSTAATTTTTTTTAGVGGGDPSTTSSGQGGSGAHATGNGWVAGTDAEDYDGDVISSGSCNAGSSPPSSWGWLSMLALVGLWRRPRRANR
jgi:MYXO-CTERM domain-containing protein